MACPDRDEDEDTSQYPGSFAGSVLDTLALHLPSGSYFVYMIKYESKFHLVTCTVYITYLRNSMYSVYMHCTLLIIHCTEF